MNPTDKSKLVDEYISTFYGDVKQILDNLRELIIKKAPQATETIAYNMPAYKIKGKPLIYFAGYKNHVGLYATPSGHSKFKERLSKYKQGRGSVQFPINQPIPYELIKEIVEFRVTELS